MIEPNKINNNQLEIIRAYISVKDTCAHDPSHITTTQKLAKCSKCKFTYYCNAECQKKDWSRHKQICDILKAHTQDSSPIISDNFYRLIKLIKSSLKIRNFTDDKVFICTNETDVNKTIELVSGMNPVGNTIIGVGGFFTLDLASTRSHVDHIIILDSSISTRLFWDNVAPLITKSSSRADCLEKIQLHLKNNMKKYVPQKAPEDKIQQYAAINCLRISQESYWLADEDRFTRIQQIFKKGHFAFHQLDLRDSTACLEILKIQQVLKLKTDIIYLSNVHSFIHKEHFQKYKETLEYLTSGDTIIIDTKDETFKITKLISRIFSRYTLQQSIRFASFYEVTPQLPLEQRIRQKEDRSIEELYPIIKLARESTDDDFFYDYGIQQGYFTEQEMNTVSEKVDKVLAPYRKENEYASSKLLEQVTISALYPSTLTSTSLTLL